MIKSIAQSYFFIRKSLFDDLLDRYLFLASLLLLVIDLIIWKSFITDTFIFLKINIQPVRFLELSLLINTILAISAHDKEKEVGYLLLMGNIILGLLVFILEIFYLNHL